MWEGVLEKPQKEVPFTMLGSRKTKKKGGPREFIDKPVGRKKGGFQTFIKNKKKKFTTDC